MERNEFAQFLGKLKNANDNGQDIDAFVKQYEHRNVYFYNDGCIKKILANEKNLMLTTDLVNAALGLIGSDRIANPKLVNPFIPGELGYHSVEPDILLTNDRGEKNPRDRISIEVQHEDNYSLFKVLQNEVKLCNFSSRYLMTVDMSDFDRAVAEYSTKMDIAKKMLEQGKLSVTEISAVTGLPEAKIRDLK